MGIGKGGLAALAVLLVLAAAQAQAATTRYVQHHSQGGQDMGDCTDPDIADACATIQYAVDQSGPDDTIRIGPGLFPDAVFVGDHPLHFVGTLGFIDTVLDASNQSAEALYMQRGGSIRNMVLRGTELSTDETLLLESDSGGPPVTYDVSTVEVVADDTSANGALSVYDDGGPVTVNVDGGRFASSESGPAVRAQGSGTVVNFTGTLIEGPSFDPAVNVSEARVNLVESRILDTYESSRGIYLGSSGAKATAVELTRSTVVARDTALNIDMYGGAGSASAVVRNSVLAVNDPSTDSAVENAVSIENSAAGVASLEATGTTFDARSTAHEGAALHILGESGAPATATVRNSIMRSTGSALVRDVRLTGPGAQLSATHSNWTTAQVTDGATSTPPGSGTNVPGDPRFENGFNGDFDLQPDSPLIDRGDPAVVTAGELDRDGGARSLDGDGNCVVAPDMGAFERPTVVADCPDPPPGDGGGAGPGGGPGPGGTGPGGGAAPDTTAPVLSGVSASARVLGVRARAAQRPPSSVRVSWTLSEPATVNVVVQRRAPGRRVGRRCRKPTPRLRNRRRCRRWARQGALSQASQAGPGSLSISGSVGNRRLRPGRHRLLVFAVDAAGNRSARHTLPLRVVRR